MEPLNIFKQKAYLAASEMNDTIEKKNRQHSDAPIVSWRLAGPFQQLVRHGSIHAIGQFPGKRTFKTSEFALQRIVQQTPSLAPPHPRAQSHSPVR